MPFKINETGYWESPDLEGHCFDHRLCDSIGALLKLQQCTNVIDLGCGPGWYVRELRKQNFEIAGFDGNPNTVAISREILNDGTTCSVLDLTIPMLLETPADCILCLEVGEHIPEQFETVFIENLVHNASGMIILSWAVEGQDGDGHVNCRNNSYIINRMKTYGFRENIRGKNKLRLDAYYEWFCQSLMVFERTIL
ncbi:class I SAM-dependent methyltransferase [Chitinophaga sp. RAB17]|uniref:class I SAM-dependent methyltransferase n=1 Tax=Chitinophaga sp. RAB17 TaxID=3233049 RepID=UPI003F9118FC